ncbi:hypothetical protein [Sorangium sp. So ce1151]|uniref:hypothetical protein n=1 Tax=Sorangium sp. So ce1151 TaxID=3133332 RepID=UPI003F61EB04
MSQPDAAAMRVELAFVPGFSASLAGWEATLVAGGRGSLKCHWIGPSGPEERSRARHDFPLTPPQFERLCRVLEGLPAEIGASTIDDAPVRHIRCHAGDRIIERRRSVWKKGVTPPEADFDRVWFELFALVRPALLDLGMPASRDKAGALP